jgi:hypothetical protein
MLEGLQPNLADSSMVGLTPLDNPYLKAPTFQKSYDRFIVSGNYTPGKFGPAFLLTPGADFSVKLVANQPSLAEGLDLPEDLTLPEGLEELGPVLNRLCFPDNPPWAPVVVNKQQYAEWLRKPTVRRMLREEPEQFPLFALTEAPSKVPFQGVCDATCAQTRQGQNDQDLRSIRGACRTFYKREYCFKWVIPKREFEWTGRFVVKSLGLETKLTIRGKKQNGSFDILMKQGCVTDEDPICVENLVYGNKFYTITHRWPDIEGISTAINGKCIYSTNPVSVDDLNFLLRSARFVGTEKVDQEKMDHFRVTCLGRTVVPLLGRTVGLCQGLSVFSDLYVPRGRGKPFYRWLQYGDGVGLDPQQDEWFFIDRKRHRAGPIRPPKQCLTEDDNPAPDAIPVLQQPCKNLVFLQ